MPLTEYWPVIVVGATGAIGYGELRARVASIRKDVDKSASAEVVAVQYGEIIRRLDRIERQRDREEQP